MAFQLETASASPGSSGELDLDVEPPAGGRSGPPSLHSNRRTLDMPVSRRTSRREDAVTEAQEFARRGRACSIAVTTFSATWSLSASSQAAPMKPRGRRLRLHGNALRGLHGDPQARRDVLGLRKSSGRRREGADMPVKRRKSKMAAWRITPEAMAAFEAGDERALRSALGLPPWARLDALARPRGVAPLWRTGHVHQRNLAGGARNAARDRAVGEAERPAACAISDSFAHRIEHRRRLFLAEVQRQGWWVSADERVGQRDAASCSASGTPIAFAMPRRRCREDWPRVS